MSVTTTADERLADAKTHISTAISCLSDIVIDKCWGVEDFSKLYYEDIRKALYDLIEIRDRISK